MADLCIQTTNPKAFATLQLSLLTKNWFKERFGDFRKQQLSEKILQYIFQRFYYYIRSYRKSRDIYYHMQDYLLCPLSHDMLTRRCLRCSGNDRIHSYYAGHCYRMDHR